MKTLTRKEEIRKEGKYVNYLIREICNCSITEVRCNKKGEKICVRCGKVHL